MSFDRFVAIDWTGGRQRRSPALKIATCRPGEETPALAAPPAASNWARTEVLAWLHEAAAGERLLVGMDSSFALPWLDLGCYFPSLDASPKDAPSLWAAVEAASATAAGLYAGAFARDGRYAPYFFADRKAGRRHQRRYRLSEHLCRETGLGPVQTGFHLVGPNQVGLASLSSMRLLTRLDRRLYSIWPFDKEARGRSVLCEIYTGLFLRMAGAGNKKVRDRETLNAALGALGSASCDAEGPLDDHATDAILSAAALRRIAGKDRYWSPPALSDRVRRTEGWVFGVA